VILKIAESQRYLAFIRVSLRGLLLVIWDFLEALNEWYYAAGLICRGLQVLKYLNPRTTKG